MNMEQLLGLLKEKVGDNFSAVGYLIRDIFESLAVIARFKNLVIRFNSPETPSDVKALIVSDSNNGILSFGEDFIDGIFICDPEKSKRDKNRYARYADDNTTNRYFGNAARICWILSRLDPFGNCNTLNVVRNLRLVGDAIREEVGNMIDAHTELEGKIKLDMPDDHPFDTYPECHTKFYELCIGKFHEETIEFADRLENLFQKILAEIEANLKAR